MSQEEFQKLRAELESLRQENRRLRSVAHIPKNQNGHSPTVLPKHENLIPAFNQQLQRIKLANTHLGKAMENYQELSRSLETLIPALEVQLKGWVNQLQQQKDSQQGTESAYASVVDGLEGKLKKLRGEMDQLSKESEMRLGLLQQENSQLKAQLTSLQQGPQLARTQDTDVPDKGNETSPATGAETPDDPFRTLNIFGI